MTDISEVEIGITDTDNRDSVSTKLTLNIRKAYGITVDTKTTRYVVEVDPVELFRNMLENAGMSSIEAGSTIDDIMARLDEIANPDRLDTMDITEE